MVRSEDTDIRPAMVSLVGGCRAIVDRADLPLVNRYAKWYITSGRKDGLWYAWAYRGKVNGKNTQISMHRLLMDDPRGVMVDHVNGVGLDNRRCNLRLAPNQQNQANSRLTARNKSGRKGVSWHAGRWRAAVTVDGHRIHLGRFDDLNDAAEAYDQAATLHFGDHALTNAKLGLGQVGD